MSLVILFLVFPLLSSGLPPDISNEEFVEMMSKCGIVMRDPITDEYKIKLYKDKDGNLKGDGLCCYLKVRQIFCLPYVFVSAKIYLPITFIAMKLPLSTRTQLGEIKFL